MNLLNLRKTALAAMVAATMGFAVVPVPGFAADVYFNVAPPAPRVEVVPASRAGHLWVPGYWDARGHRHHWTSGRWERERRGYRFVEPKWVERQNRWYLERPRWQRGDRDGDGVPNRLDRHPNNPNRR